MYEQINAVTQFNFQINRVLTYGDAACDHEEIARRTSGQWTASTELLMNCSMIMKYMRFPIRRHRCIRCGLEQTVEGRS